MPSSLSSTSTTAARGAASRRARPSPSEASQAGSACPRVDALDDAHRIAALRSRLPAGMKGLANEDLLHGHGGRWTRVRCRLQGFPGCSWFFLTSSAAAITGSSLISSSVLQVGPARAGKPDAAAVHETLMARLCAFEAVDPGASNAQERTLYSMLRAALAECAATHDARAREHVVCAAADWFSKGLTRIRCAAGSMHSPSFFRTWCCATSAFPIVCVLVEYMVPPRAVCRVASAGCAQPSSQPAPAQLVAPARLGSGREHTEARQQRSELQKAYSRSHTDKAAVAECMWDAAPRGGVHLQRVMPQLAYCEDRVRPMHVAW